MKKILLLILIAFLITVAALSISIYISESPQQDTLTEAQKVGPTPTLPKPEHHLIPTVKIAKAIGWPNGMTPIAAAGLKVNAFAKGLKHPRWIYRLPNGDVLVAESNAPARSRSNKNLSLESKVKRFVAKILKRQAGAGVASPNTITLLRDTTGRGVADKRTVFLEHLNSPFGMALVGHYFYVANADAIIRYPYTTGETSIKAPGVKVVDLMGKTTLNHHWTKSLVPSHDGAYLYVGIGSNSNIGENGLDEEVGRAAIWKINRLTGQHHIFASGLRNPVGLAWNPQTHALWAVVNERDDLGNDLVPDYLTSVKEGAFYGWPYSYYGQHIDLRVQPQKPALVATALSPDYALGSHVASLGLTFYTDHLLPKKYFEGAFIGEHGSWNRNPATGYKVVFIKFVNGKPVGLPQNILTGFLSPQGDAYGRPVGVTTDKKGALLVADDVGNIIWRVSPLK